MIGDTQDAVAATQEAMLAIAEEIADSGSASSFTIWAYRLTMTAATDELARRRQLPPPYRSRAQTVDAGLFGPSAEPSVTPVGAGGAEAGTIDAGAGARLPLDELLEQVPDEYRSAAVLRDMLNLAYPQMAEVLGVPASSVSLRIAHGRSALSHALAGTGTAPATPDSIGPHRYGHPSVLELSWFLDSFLSHPEEAWVATHLDTCGPCVRELEELKSARRVISSAGLPPATSAARDRAVTAALSFTPRAIRELDRWIDTSADVPSDATGTAVAAGTSGPSSPPAPASVTVGAAAGASAPFSRPKPQPTHREAVLAATVADVAGAATAEPPDRSGWPRSVDRRRRPNVALRAAAVVVIAGALGGTVVALLPSHHRPVPTAIGTTVTTTTSHVTTKSGHSTPPPTQAAANPPATALSLQLRPRLGSASCTKLARHLESVDGVLVAASPSASAGAVMALPTSTPQAPACVNVGSAFAIAWSGDIARVTVKPLSPTSVSTSAPAGNLVQVVIDLKSRAVTSISGLTAAENAETTTDVVAQGIDLGTAVVSIGPVVTLTVTQSVATFLQDQLATHHS